MTIRFLGISFRLNASVEVIIRFLSNGMKGKIVGFEPVAMIAYFVSENRNQGKILILF